MGDIKGSTESLILREISLDIPATVERIEYDPNRTAHIALIKYKDGDFSYIICPQKIKNW